MMEGNYQGQRWAEWFLWKEGIPAGDIHHHLTAVCKYAAPRRATVFQWIQNLKDGNESAEKRISTGHLSMSLTLAMIQ
jgi:hypothetical protein